MDSAGTFSTNGRHCGYRRTCSPTYPVRGICPEGWHLPDTSEWNALFVAVGGKSKAGRMLKSTSGWNGSGSGTDSYGFAALPAGFRYYDGRFNYVGGAYFWSATDEHSSNAYGVYLDYSDDDASRFNNYKTYGLSVRCLQD